MVHIDTPSLQLLSLSQADSLIPHLDHLITISNLSLKVLETDFAVDSNRRVKANIVTSVKSVMDMQDCSPITSTDSSPFVAFLYRGNFSRRIKPVLCPLLVFAIGRVVAYRVRDAVNEFVRIVARARLPLRSIYRIEASIEGK